VGLDEMTDLARKKLYYRTQPAFRARVLASVKARHERNKADPEYRRLVYLRKRIYDRRQKIERWLDLVRRAEVRLLIMVRERDEIVARRRGSKGASNV
jgi:hypothetical protein